MYDEYWDFSLERFFIVIEIVDYSQSPISLLAPAIAIIMAVLTRRVLLSLGLGIVVGAILLVNGNVWQSITLMGNYLLMVFWNNGLNIENICILLFLIVLGMLTGLINVSGGTRAFGNWAKYRIKSRRNCQVLTVILGGVIFIDDYFSSLAVGSVCRPLSDQYHISRAKLAYLIDSTAAPVCVIMPISSWGAYVIALLGAIMATHNMPYASPVNVFFDMILMNFYAVFALALVICVAWMDLNVGVMKKHEDRAKQKGELFDVIKGIPAGSADMEEVQQGYVSDLLVPLSVLIMVTFITFIISGAFVILRDGHTLNFLKVLENAHVGLSLVLGGLVSLCVILFRLFNRGVGSKLCFISMKCGVISMMPAIFILVLAWLLVGITSDLNPGKYLASIVDGRISSAYYPLVIFCISSLMAFATGTSWGTFGIMLPVAGDMAAASDMGMMLPMLSAVLAGAVFGDHCSPISDTTVLSSTGAACHHSDHVITQIPYALSVAFVSACGYLAVGLLNSIILGFCVALVLFILVIMVFKKYTVMSAIDI